MGHAYGVARTAAREKTFGFGKPCGLDRNVRERIMTLARALMRRQEGGKHYGPVTAKTYQVLGALLWKYHNAKDGRCFPAHKEIADYVGCAKSTVQKAIAALEACGLLTWVHRLIRKREYCPLAGWRWRVYRTSNSYLFNDPHKGQVIAPPGRKTSITDFPGGTTIPDSSFEKREPAQLELLPPVAAALARLSQNMGVKKGGHRSR